VGSAAAGESNAFLSTLYLLWLAGVAIIWAIIKWEYEWWLDTLSMLFIKERGQL
jgi:hypothetical protein